MERLEYGKYGGPDVVKLAPFTLADPKGNEIIVRVRAASINPMDWKIRRGDLKVMTGFTFPRALGTDFSGIVESVGKGVSRFRVGDTVLGTVSMKRSGAFAPKLVTTDDLVVHKPSEISFVDAACLPIAGVTAWHVLIKTAGLKHGQRLFINGATGAVGQAAIAIAKGMGVEVIGRVGPRSVEKAASLGLFQAIDYTQPLPQELDGMFDIVFDANGSLSVKEGNRLIKQGGTIIDIVPTKKKFLIALISRSRRFVFADVKAENLQRVVQLAVAGKLTIPVAKTVSLTEAASLLASLEGGKRLDGKAVITF